MPQLFLLEKSPSVLLLNSRVGAFLADHCLRPLFGVPPRAPLIADRLSRIEAGLAALSDEIQQLRLFCLDIHPEYGERIITTMQEMEQKVYLNVTSFESRLAT